MMINLDVCGSLFVELFRMIIEKIPDSDVDCSTARHYGVVLAPVGRTLLLFVLERVTCE